MGEAIAFGQLVFGAVFFLYWGMAAFCLLLALWRPKTAKRRAVYAAIVVALFGFIPSNAAFQHWKEQPYREAAFAHFKKRCAENAGEKINQVVENVEAVFIAKPRVWAGDAELRDPNWMGDPYGYSGSEALDPVGAYLYDRSGRTVSDVRFTPIKGYKFVEVPNPAYRENANSKPYIRYHLEWRDVLNTTINISERKLVPVGEPVAELRSAYGVTWEDVSTPEDRRYWVAGGSLTVFDVRAKHVLGVRIGYVIDPWLGNTSTGRVSWRNGIYCPPFENQQDRNKEFVAKVLKPSN